MSLFNGADRRVATAISGLAYCNPFLPKRIDFERAALDGQFDESQAFWNTKAGQRDEFSNVVRLVQFAKTVVHNARSQLQTSHDWPATDLALYEDVVLFVLYDQYRMRFNLDGSNPTWNASTLYQEFRGDVQHLLGPAVLDELPHLFACFYQLVRAFYNIFNFIIGVSPAAVALRAAAWQSIFTHDMRRYRRLLFNGMSLHATMISGPSGTGKELVAKAIGFSQYIPFDPHAGRFIHDPSDGFIALNLSALTSTLIESELFGHARGAFTGATAARTGWLELCPAFGTILLDEIGDLDPMIQIKLLRLLESRTYSRIGESKLRQFRGKFIVATNHDLLQLIRKGRFREDFYFRLCSDIIVTPTLRERFSQDHQELRCLVEYLAKKIVEDEAGQLAEEVLEWIENHLGLDYPWPGNVRELDQCVRNVLIRGEYHPRLPTARRPDASQKLVRKLRHGKITIDSLLAHYCRLVYKKTGSLADTARRLRIDRRTVKAYLQKRNSDSEAV